MDIYPVPCTVAAPSGFAPDGARLFRRVTRCCYYTHWIYQKSTSQTYNKKAMSEGEAKAVAFAAHPL